MAKVDDQTYRYRMSSSADSETMANEVVKNGKPCADEELTAVASQDEHKYENATSEAAQTESLSDWLVMICVFLCNVLNGINYASYGVMYLPITEMFQSSRAAVGWIVSFDFALASFLGELCHILCNAGQFIFFCVVKTSIDILFKGVLLIC